MQTVWVVNQFGGYNDFCYFPLKDAEPEKIYAFPTPDPDDFNYSAVVDQAHFYKDKAIYVGNAGIPDLINSMGRVMGMEDALVNIYTDDEATMDLIKRKISFELAKTERELDALKKAGEEADFLWIGEDLGTQTGPMISMELFRRTFKPIMKQFVELADSYHIPTMIHSCGSSGWAYEEYIDIAC